MPPIVQHQPLTAVTLVCALRLEFDVLAPTISAFVDPKIRKRWTVERACEHNNLPLLRYLVANEPLEMEPFYRLHVLSRALVFAVRHDNVELLECLCVHYCPTGNVSRGMAEAAALGKVHLMEWFIANCAKVEAISACAQNAARAGHLHVLQWLQSQPATTKQHLIAAIPPAALAGQFAMVRWLHENTATATDCLHYPNALISATKGGHLDILKYLVETGYKCLVISRLMETAVEVGHIEIAQWLHENGLARFSRSLLNLASSRGYNEMVKWLTKMVEVSLYQGYDSLLDAAEHCNLETVQTIHAVYPLTHYGSVLSRAAGSGRLDIVEWLYCTGETSPREAEALADGRRYGYSYASALGRAARNGHFATVQWLVRNLRHHTDDYEKAEEDAVTDAGGGGHFKIVEWLHAQRTSEKRPYYNITKAAGNGHLEIVQWMIANADIGFDDVSTVSLAATNGHLDVLIWLYSRFNGLKCYPSAMTGAVVNNHLRVVQWLHTNRKGDITKECKDNVTSFEMTQWLHVHSSAGCSTAAMDNAATRGDFDSLLFLHKHSSGGCSLNAAYGAYEGDHVHIFEWLCDMYPEVVKVDIFRSRLCQIPGKFMTPLFDRVGLERHYFN